MDLLFILDAVNEEALTETLRPAIAGVNGVSAVELNDGLRLQLADLLATAEVVDEFGDMLLIVHAEDTVDENAVSIAVNAHNPATPSTAQAQQAAWALVASAADAALLAVNWQAHAQDIAAGRSAANAILADANLPVATRNRIGNLFLGVMDKLEFLGRMNLRMLQTFAKTNDTSVP